MLVGQGLRKKGNFFNRDVEGSSPSGGTIDLALNIYTAEAQFSNEEEQKLKNWIEQRLNINNVQIFK